MTPATTQRKRMQSPTRPHTTTRSRLDGVSQKELPARVKAATKGPPLECDEGRRGWASVAALGRR